MRTFTIGGFVAIALAMVVLEVVARSPSTAVATWSEVVRHVLRSRPAQLGMVLAWWWIGVHFL